VWVKHYRLLLFIHSADTEYNLCLMNPTLTQLIYTVTFGFLYVLSNKIKKVPTGVYNFALIRIYLYFLFEAKIMKEDCIETCDNLPIEY